MSNRSLILSVMMFTIITKYDINCITDKLFLLNVEVDHLIQFLLFPESGIRLLLQKSEESILIILI